MCTPATLPGCFGDADFAMPDPGSAVALPRSAGRAYIGFVTGASGETNTLADPVKAGQELVLYLRTDGGGDRVVTVASAFDIAGNTVLTFANAGEYAAFVSVAVGTSWKWKLVASNILSGLGATLAEIALLSGLLATAAEINRAADVSTRIVPLAVTTAITEAAHEGKTIVMSGAGAARTFTLPAATGGGGRYRFVVGEVNTSNYLIKAAVGTDLFEGIIIGASTTDSATDAARTWLSGATDDTITLNGTTTGGVAIGDWIEFEDISATGWAVRGMITQSGSEATPFSDTVT